jgi:hypothetical protein
VVREAFKGSWRGSFSDLFDPPAQSEFVVFIRADVGAPGTLAAVKESNCVCKFPGCDSCGGSRWD